MTRTGGTTPAGIEIVVCADDSVPLGAVPVLDAQDWGGRTDGTAEFIMPLSPQVLILGAPDPDLTPGEVRVVAGPGAHEDLVRWQVAGSPGLISSPFVVCEPSSAARNSQTALHFAEGGAWHRFVIEDRIEVAIDAPTQDRVTWKDRQACQRSDNTMYRSPFATESNRTKIREASAARAHLTQRELDVLDVPICRCDHHRKNPRTSSAWEQIMPQVVCDAVRRERNQARRTPP